jgi:hypothetical protein
MCARLRQSFDDARAWAAYARDVSFHDEHDRYDRLVARVSDESDPGAQVIAEFMRNVNADPDPVMAESATIALLDLPRLTISTLDVIERQMPAGWSAAASRLSERRLQLQLEASRADRSAWDTAVSSESRRVHLWLLDQPDIPPSTLESLAEHGATKAIRNRAAEALRRRSAT